MESPAALQRHLELRPTHLSPASQISHFLLCDLGEVTLSAEEFSRASFLTQSRAKVLVSRYLLPPACLLHCSPVQLTPLRSAVFFLPRGQHKLLSLFL